MLLSSHLALPEVTPISPGNGGGNMKIDGVKTTSNTSSNGNAQASIRIPGLNIERNTPPKAAIAASAEIIAATTTKIESFPVIEPSDSTDTGLDSAVGAS